MSPSKTMNLLIMFIVICLFGAACGSEDSTETTVAAAPETTVTTAAPTTTTTETPTTTTTEAPTTTTTEPIDETAVLAAHITAQFADWTPVMEAEALFENLSDGDTSNDPLVVSVRSPEHLRAWAH